MDILIFRCKKIELSGHMNYDFFAEKENYLLFFGNFAKRNAKSVINSYGWTRTIWIFVPFMIHWSTKKISLGKNGSHILQNLWCSKMQLLENSIQKTNIEIGALHSTVLHVDSMMGWLKTQILRDLEYSFHHHV